MMIISFGSKKIGEIEYNDLVNELTQLTFFAFMENGRSGLRAGLETCFDCFSTWVNSKSPQMVTAQELNEQMPRLIQVCLPWLVDGFITTGTAGLRTAIMTSYAVFYQTFIVAVLKVV